MSNPSITTEHELREIFWQQCDECENQHCTYRGKSKTFNLEANMCFNEFKDSMAYNGEITADLRDRATLFD